MSPSHLLAVPRSLNGLWERGYGEGAELPACGEGGGGHPLGNGLGWTLLDVARGPRTLIATTRSTHGER